jgi:protein KRI1
MKVLFSGSYVLNRGWLENPNAAPKGKASKKPKPKRNNEADLSSEGEGEAGLSDVDSEDSFDSRAEAFENAYNFRFEELEGGEAEAQIQSYARNPIGSVRRTEDKRKKEREERAKRKQEEKEVKKKEIDRMRELKRKSIVDRLKKLKEATGSTNVDFERFQLDNEFDPEEHDRLMQGAFDDEYYGGQDEDGKPTWDDDIEIDGINDNKGKKSKSKKAAIEMDADFMEQDEPIDAKKLSKAEKKKLKKREKAKAKKKEEEQGGQSMDVGEEEMNAEVVDDVEEVDYLNPEERKRKMEEAMDEYYGLEYEDMIGDQPTRFKYTPVTKSAFGLTPEEILLADDEDLKGVVSLKRLQPYRDGKKRPSDLNVRVKEFRRKFYQDREKDLREEERQEKSKTKRMGKKERQRRKEASEKAAEAEAKGESKGGESTSSAVEGVQSEEPPKKKKKLAKTT